MPTSPIEVLLQRDMEWRADDVTKFAADISSRVGDADTLVGAPSIKDVEYKEKSDVNDADMLVGSQVVKEADIGSTVARKDEGKSQPSGLQRDVQAEVVTADGLAVEQRGGPFSGTEAAELFESEHPGVLFDLQCND